MRCVSLFSGIGGLDLGLERAGIEVVAHAEVDEFASRVLAARWPGVPNLGDVSEVTYQLDDVGRSWAFVGGSHYMLGEVDVVAGGFPCQDVSLAGKNNGLEEGTRSGLFRELLRAARDLQPRFLVVENVPGLINRGLDVVLGEMAALGYDAEWDCIPAAAVGAPQKRDRLFLVGERSDMANAARLRMEGHGPARLEISRLPTREEISRRHSAGRRAGEWEAEPRLGRLADGVSGRVQLAEWRARMKALGNAVVPQVAELVGEALVAYAAATEPGATMNQANDDDREVLTLW